MQIRHAGSGHDGENYPRVAQSPRSGAQSAPLAAHVQENVRNNTGPLPRPDHRIGYAGDVDADAQFDHRQRRAALHAGQHVGVGYDEITWVLTSYVIAAAIMTAAGRLAGGPVRPQAAVHRLHRRLHRRLHAVRRGAVAGANRRFPPAPGHVRRRAGAAVAGDDARHLSVSRSAPRRWRSSPCGVTMGPDGRPDPRRLPDRLYYWRWVFYVNLPFGILAFVGCCCSCANAGAAAS